MDVGVEEGLHVVDMVGVVMNVGIMEVEDTAEDIMLLQSMPLHLCTTLPIHIRRLESALLFP
jgi:hypothetical protein